MIDGVTLRECVVREDERGWLTEFLSVNMGDEDLCHVYASMARPGVAKAFHAHLQQADRFICIAGTAKIGMVDLRGPLFSEGGLHEERHPTGWTAISFWSYLGSESELFHTWAYDAAGINQLGEYGVGGAQIRKDNLEALDAWWKQLAGESTSFLEQQTVILSSERPAMLTIPPGVAHGQYALGGEQSVILNAPTVAFNRDAPDELRMPADSFGYQWGVESK